MTDKRLRESVSDLAFGASEKTRRRRARRYRETVGKRHVIQRYENEPDDISFGSL